MWVRFPSGALGAFYMEEKMKNLLEKILPFVKENKRYIGVVGLFACFVLILVFFTGDAFNSKRLAQLNSKEVSGEDYVPDAKFEVDAYPEINKLIQTYFDAYVNADFTTLETVAYPVSEMEKNYITTMSQFYESYQNVKCYTKHGLSKDSFIVSARFDIKFVGQDVTAPSMLLFYVQTDKEGKLYINNLYSDFNMQYSEVAIDKDVYTALRKYTIQDDYLELYNEVEIAFNQLIRENTDIYQLTKRTIPGIRQLWEDTVYFVQQDSENVDDTQGTEGTENTDVTETTENTEDTQETEQTDEPEPTVTKVKVVNVSLNVNIREKASASSADIGDAHNGDVFVKLGVETDANGDEWTKIQFDGDKVGYIKSTFLEEITE